MILGFVTFSANLFYNRPFIGLLNVRDTQRRRGVATALLQRVLDVYEGLDVWTSTEQWNQNAIHLFQKLGFVQKGRIDGLDDAKSSSSSFITRK